MSLRALKALVRYPEGAYNERELEGEIKKGYEDEDRGFGVGESRAVTLTPLKRRNMKRPVTNVIPSYYLVLSKCPTNVT